MATSNQTPALLQRVPQMIQAFPVQILRKFSQIISAFYTSTSKKGKRKVQGVPQSQTAALPRPQEEEETDKSKQAQIEQTYKKH